MKWLPILLIWAAALLFYHPALTTYFSQDDFFHIKISQTDGSAASFLKLFGFYPFEERGIAFYRPIFREVFFNIFYGLFGLNQLPYRLFAFFVHFANVVLVYMLLQRMFGRRELSLFAAFFYGVSAANVATLYYLTGGIQSLGATMFILLTLILFWDGRRKLSFLTFLLALGSHELAAVLPALLAGVALLKRLPIKHLWPHFSVLLLYLYLDLAVIGFSSGEQQYQIVLSIKKAANTFAWYMAWAWGLPEMLVDFVRPGLQLNPSLMRYWGGYFKVVFAAFLASVALFLGAFVFLLLRGRKIFADKRLWFFVFWGAFGIVPVVLLPLHKSAYYLAPVLPAFWTVVGFLVFSAYWLASRRYRQVAAILCGLFLGALALLSLVSARLGEQTYWAASRGRLAQKLLNDVKAAHRQLPAGSGVYFVNDPTYPFVADQWGSTSKQASFILNGSDALQLFYKDPTLRVFYEDLGGVPEDFPKDKLVTVVAKLAQ